MARSVIQRDEDRPTTLVDLESLQTLVGANDRRLTELLSLHVKRLEDLIDDLDKRSEQRHTHIMDISKSTIDSTREAITKADAAYEKRFDANNEWKNTYATLSSQTVTRTEYDAGRDSTKSRLDDFGTSLKAIEARSAGSKDTITMGVAVIAVLVSLGLGAISFFPHSSAPAAPTYAPAPPTVVSPAVIPVQPGPK